MADSIKWTGPNGNTVGMESLKQSIQFWMDTFDEMTYSEGDGLPGTDVGFGEETHILLRSNVWS